ncbi:MAG: GNAT family N-acetyltransferase [Micromonosporaceae bacterium]
MTTSGVIDSVDQLTLRYTDISDLPAVAAMHHRCSMRSRYRRYMSGMATPTRRHLVSLIASPYGYAVVAETADGQIVALGNLMWTRPDAGGEIALLVEDAWQRRGLGGALLRRLYQLAGQIGVGSLHLHTHLDNAGLIRAVEALGKPLHRGYADGVLTLTLDTDAVPPSARHERRRVPRAS